MNSHIHSEGVRIKLLNLFNRVFYLQVYGPYRYHMVFKDQDSQFNFYGRRWHFLLIRSNANGKFFQTFLSPFFTGIGEAGCSIYELWTSWLEKNHMFSKERSLPINFRGRRWHLVSIRAKANGKFLEIYISFHNRNWGATIFWSSGIQLPLNSVFSFCFGVLLFQFSRPKISFSSSIIYSFLFLILLFQSKN